MIPRMNAQQEREAIDSVVLGSIGSGVRYLRHMGELQVHGVTLTRPEIRRALDRLARRRAIRFSYGFVRGWTVVMSEVAPCS